MKRIMLISIIVLFGLLMVLPAQAQPTTWISPGDFTTKFWKEKLFGGYHGAEGNVLMAVGQGFTFQNAVLTVGPQDNGLPEWCSLLGGAATYRTVYEDGMLTLNPSGPWKKNYKAKDVTATNYSCHGANGLIGFRLEMTGQFDKSLYFYDITVTFNVGPDNYIVKPDADKVVFHEGYNFGAEITIY